MFEELQTWPNVKWNTRTQHIWPAVVCHGLQDGRSVRPYVYAAGWLSLRLSCPHLMSFYLDSQHSLFGWRRRRKGSKIFYDIKIVWLYPATSWLVRCCRLPTQHHQRKRSHQSHCHLQQTSSCGICVLYHVMLNIFMFLPKGFLTKFKWVMCCNSPIQWENVVATGEGVIRSSTPTVGCCSRYLVKIHSLFAIDFFWSSSETIWFGKLVHRFVAKGWSKKTHMATRYCFMFLKISWVVYILVRMYFFLMDFPPPRFCHVCFLCTWMYQTHGKQCRATQFNSLTWIDVAVFDKRYMGETMMAVEL